MESWQKDLWWNAPKCISTFSAHNIDLYTFSTYAYSMYLVFVETASFTKNLSSYMDDEEYANFQAYLMANPEVGDVILRSNGLRKVRWAGKGKGKRGGIRVIYYNRLNNGKI